MRLPAGYFWVLAREEFGPRGRPLQLCEGDDVCPGMRAGIVVHLVYTLYVLSIA